ncbi:MAG TPA: prolyl oligopeptidase family serine peptidase [Polyangiaceae bacterium]|nr:prolyl oligopeptidase family serine peptidase [Polyangiaceae bacterium]
MQPPKNRRTLAGAGSLARRARVAFGLALLLGCAENDAMPPKPPLPPPAPVTVATASASTIPPAPAPRFAYPPTRVDDLVETLHGVRVADPYRWLEDGASPEVQAWAKAENAFARAWLDKLPERDALAKRLHELYDIERVWAPVKRGHRYFWNQKDVGREKEVVFWREGRNGEKKVLLDPNTWSADGSVSLGHYRVSWDGKLVAYLVKKNNSDEAVLEIIDVASGKKQHEVIEGAKYADPQWNPAGTGFYYTRIPPVGGAVTVAERPGFAEIRFHRVGDDPAKDALVRAATHDPKTFHAVDLSRDGRYLTAAVQHGWASSDLYLQDLVKKPGVWQPIVEGQSNLYDTTAHDGTIYVLTNQDAPHFRILRVDAAHAGDRSKWVEIVPERPDTVIERMSFIGGRMALVTIHDAVQGLEVRELDGKLAYEVKLPEPGTVSMLSGNEGDDEAYYRSEGFSRPPEIYELSVKTGKSTLRYQTHVPADPSRYVTEQRFATSKDGTKVPYFLMHAKDRPLDGSAPALLYGYGGFNVALTPSFSTTSFPWLEHGGVFAIANLRGGSEYGEAWHRAGMRHEKQHVFDDFIAVAEALVASRATSPDRLVIRGESNGGLLVGAALTQRPDLFRVALCGVPLLDMVRYELFGSGKTWIEEYGTATDPADFQALYAYSPYHHVTPGTAYPSVLLFSADNDDRVDPMHARKFAAMLQARSSGGPVLLRIQAHAGHGGADKIQALVDERADGYAFALSQVAH